MAASELANPVTEYLIGQQCTAGFFRLDLGDTAVDTCDAAVPAATPNTDATALAVINLLGQVDDTDVQASVDQATDWLVSTQNADGSFGSDAMIATANANSTGLAAWALGEVGESAAAEKAAVWLRGHQVTNTASCTPYAPPTRARSPTTTRPRPRRRHADQRRHLRPVPAPTSQSLPGLRYAPDGVSSEVTSDSAYVHAGSVQRVLVSALAGHPLSPERQRRRPAPSRHPRLGRHDPSSATLPAGTATAPTPSRTPRRSLGTVVFLGPCIGVATKTIGVPRPGPPVKPRQEASSSQLPARRWR